MASVSSIARSPTHSGIHRKAANIVVLKTQILGDDGSKCRAKLIPCTNLPILTRFTSSDSSLSLRKGNISLLSAIIFHRVTTCPPFNSMQNSRTLTPISYFIRFPPFPPVLCNRQCTWGRIYLSPATADDPFLSVQLDIHRPSHVSVHGLHAPFDRISGIYIFLVPWTGKNSLENEFNLLKTNWNVKGKRP